MQDFSASVLPSRTPALWQSGQCAKASYDLSEGGRGQSGDSVFRVSATPEESTREAGEGRVCLIEGIQGQDCLRIPS